MPHDTRPDDEELARTYRELRPLLFSIAYRMLGSVTDAEDVAQECFVRYQRARDEGIVVESPKAYLSTVATRLSLDLLKSARAQRESYVGYWLPEPLVDDPLRAPTADAAAHTELADSLSMAFLIVLETLTPVERAVFLLREVFEFGYDEIASMVGKSPENCRQSLVRAKKRVSERQPRFEASRKRRAELATQFFAAAQAGDLAGLQKLLAADVVMQGDGGGKAPAAARVVAGPEKVAKLVASLTMQAIEQHFTMRPVEVNGQPGAVFYTADGLIANVVCLDIADSQVQAVRAVVNPDKLRHLGEVADLRALVHAVRSAARAPHR